jgi:hypothetical protein
MPAVTSSIKENLFHTNYTSEVSTGTSHVLSGRLAYWMSIGPWILNRNHIPTIVVIAVELHIL